MQRKRLVLAVLMALILVTACTAAAAPVEAWTTDPSTGGKICIVFVYDDEALVSASWSGPIADGKAEGKGLLNYVYLDKEKGVKEIKVQANAEMKAGKLDGKIISKSSDGNSYEGFYKEGMRDGKGVVRSSDGNSYDGEFKAGKLDGKGVYRWSNGNSYDGFYKQGVRDGKGVFKWSDGDTYEGDFKNGLREGQGVMRKGDGKVVYEGEWKNDKPVKKAD